MRNIGLGGSLMALMAAPRNGLTKLYGFNAIQRHVHRSHIKAQRGHSIAKANRWTDQPHEHKREIARRLRQQARARYNQNVCAEQLGIGSCGISRRGRSVGL